ncbi:hypothetical protein ACJX0J_028488, partial [Zea mays]
MQDDYDLLMHYLFTVVPHNVDGLHHICSLLYDTHSTFKKDPGAFTTAQARYHFYNINIQIFVSVYLMLAQLFRHFHMHHNSVMFLAFMLSYVDVGNAPRQRGNNTPTKYERNYEAWYIYMSYTKEWLYYKMKIGAQKLIRLPYIYL